MTPCSLWPLFKEYRKLEEFAKNIATINDLAERVSNYLREDHCLIT